MNPKFRSAIIVSIFCLLVDPRLFGQITNNYSCTNAVDMISGSNYVENNSSAPTTSGDAVPGCGSSIGHGVWFTVTTTRDERVNLNTGGSTFPTLMAVFTGTCGALTNAVDYYGNSLCSGSGSYLGDSSVSFSSVSNRTYYILVGSFNSSPGGNLEITALLTNPPANDTCANPTVLNNGVTVTQDVTQATEIGDVPGCSGGIGHGVWFTVTTTRDERVNLNTGGSTFPTLMAVFTGTCGALTNAVDYYGNSLCSGSGSYLGDSSVSFSSVSNRTYYILVGSFNSSPGGNLEITALLTNPPANDTCANPTVLNNGVTVTQDVTQATEIGDVPGCSGGIGHGVWFTVTTTRDERVNLNTGGSTFPTLMAVFTGTCGALTNAVDYYGNSLCSGSGSYLGDSSVSFSSVSNRTYYILVGSFNSSPGGNLEITALLTNPPANDTCANPTVLNNGVTVTQDVTQATEIGDVPGCSGGIGHGVWFTVTTTRDERVNLNTGGSTFPTLMAVFTGTCGALTNAVDYYGNSLCSGSGSYLGDSSVSFSSVSNRTYYILVGSFNSSPGGNLEITALLTNPPANDTCANPTVLNNGVTVTQDVTQATEIGDVPGCSGGIGHGVWFTVTTTRDERVNLNTGGSTFPTLMAVFTGTCGALTNAVDYYGNSLCSGSGSYLGDSSVSFSSVSNRTYYILVGSFNSSPGGNLEITALLTNPPANDTCANPTVLNNGATLTQDVTYATEVGDPTSGCNSSIGHGVWFSLAAYSGQPVTISTCGSGYSTDLLVFTNPCGAFGSQVECSSGSNSFNCAGNLAGVSFIAPTNLTYYILASGVGTAAGTLHILANSPPPGNDTCSNAMPMTPGITYLTNTVYATSIGDPTPDCSPTLGRGVWYSYMPTVSGPVGVTSCDSSFQTGLAVYTGSCGSMTEVACSQNGGAYCSSGYNADINFNGVAGTTYHILAGGVNGQAGNLQILIPIVDLVSTSLAVTNPAGGPVAAGENFTASWSVQNQGSNSINGTWIDQLVLSNANTQVILATFNSTHNGTAGGSYPESISGTMPQVQWGSYSLIAQADVSDAVAESNKTNNIQIISLAVTDIPPAISLLMPTNTLQLTSCVPLVVTLSAGVQVGSYTITNVSFFNGGTLIGQVTNAPYSTQSPPLNHGTNIITALVLDSFGLNAISTNEAIVAINWPNQTNVLRADLFSNTCVICMAALNGTNYIIEANSNANSAAWQALATNRLTGSILVFTNQRTAPMRFYRTKY